MRRSFLVVPLLIACGMPAANAAPKGPNGTLCPDPAKAPEPAQFKRLGELPPAEAFRAVYRLNEGCPAQSILASDRLGTFPQNSGQKVKR